MHFFKTHLFKRNHYYDIMVYLERKENQSKGIIFKNTVH